MRREQDVPGQPVLAPVRLAVGEDLHDGVVREVAEQQDPGVGPGGIPEGDLQRQGSLVAGRGAVVRRTARG